MRLEDPKVLPKGMGVVEKTVPYCRSQQEVKLILLGALKKGALIFGHVADFDVGVHFGFEVPIFGDVVGFDVHFDAHADVDVVDFDVVVVVDVDDFVDNAHADADVDFDVVGDLDAVDVDVVGDVDVDVDVVGDVDVDVDVVGDFVVAVGDVDVVVDTDDIEVDVDTDDIEVGVDTDDIEVDVRVYAHIDIDNQVDPLGAPYNMNIQNTQVQSMLKVCYLNNLY
eukprot:TRINITY_DN1876_c0_g2_i2.p2 TRINITY_DN1876_c0_g2~~TRINITY_DN1876_c0_g2_i2.p2  ORF type:complete len:224 (+),score=83.32 TRINITY_DN1876_c0_g2_i2:153-824(+)